MDIFNRFSNYSAILDNIKIECKLKELPKTKLLSMVDNFYDRGGMSETDKNKAVQIINEAYPD